VSDATVLLRDIAGDAASKAANKVNPSEDQLRQIDQPADDNTWHDVPSRGEIKGQLKETVDRNAPLGTQDVREAARDATSTAHPSGSSDPRDAAKLAAKDQSHGGNSGVDAAAGVRAGVDKLRNRASENVPDENKDRARDIKDTTKQKTRNYLSNKMPEERRDQTIWRLKKMVVEIQGHPDYNSAITTLLDLAEQYSGHAANLGNQAVGSAQGAHADSSLNKAERDLKTLIERFANYTSTDDLFDAINEVYRDADRDPELKNWFKHMNAYVRKCLKQQGYILEDRATDEWNQLYDNGNFLLRDRYRNHTDRIVDELNFLKGQFQEDKLNRHFGDSCQKLFDDLGNDENGKPTFKPHLVKDLSEVILPAIFENVRYVPIPRIEFKDPMVEGVIENLVIESDNLMPNSVEFASDNYFRWGRKGINNKNKNTGMISVSGIQCDLKDVSYYFKKKQGFPSLSDTGLVDIKLAGSGLSFKIKLSTADKKDRRNFFKVDTVDIDIKNFDIKVKKSKHKLLFSLFKGIMLKALRPVIQKALEKQIRDSFHQLDSYLYSIKIEADRAKEQVKDDPEQAQNIYARYVEAAKKKMTEKKQKAEEVAADKKVNVATTRETSLFPDVKLPGGISTKATEYKNLAKTGDKWGSPIFTIGSAKRTESLPAPSEIRRKPHRVTEGGVRGPQNIGNTKPITQEARDPGAQYHTQQQGGYSNEGSYPTQQQGGYSNGASDAQQFGNQINQAFKSNDNGHTTLGAQNPVLTGQAGGVTDPRY
jgi:hypothetical protein